MCKLFKKHGFSNDDLNSTFNVPFFLSLNKDHLVQIFEAFNLKKQLFYPVTGADFLTTKFSSFNDLSSSEGDKERFSLVHNSGFLNAIKML